MSTKDTEYNKLTGDAAVVLSKAQRYEELGHSIARSVLTLKNIAEADENKSKAISALKDSAKNVARDIEKAQERYSLTAEALLTYAGKLQTAQDDAVTAIAAISTAETELSTAVKKKNAAESKAETPGDDQVVNQKAAETADDDVHDAVSAVGTAHGLWHAAKKIKDDAANHAAGQIEDVVNGKVGDKLNDSLWDDLGSIKDIVKTICEVAGVLAIFLSWVPILGAVLVGLALLGALITLIDASVKFSRGEGSLSDVIFAAVGVVLAVFGGKIVSYLAKLAKFKSAGALAGRASGGQGMGFRQFKQVFGVSKTAARSELKSLTSFKGGMKEAFKNPFELKLGEGAKFTEKYAVGFKEGAKDFLSNPLKLKSLDMPWSNLTTGSKVTLIVLDARQVGGTVQTVVNNLTDATISLKPENLLKDAANGIESMVRR